MSGAKYYLTRSKKQANGRKALARPSTGDQGRGSARGLEANDEQESENCCRSERDRLKKAQKELSHSHCGIMEDGEG
jgi:hypothetical protein